MIVKMKVLAGLNPDFPNQQKPRVLTDHLTTGKKRKNRQLGDMDRMTQLEADTVLKKRSQLDLDTGRIKKNQQVRGVEC